MSLKPDKLPSLTDSYRPISKFAQSEDLKSFNVSEALLQESVVMAAVKDLHSNF